MLKDVIDDPTVRTEGRQTCAVCWTTVGTLKSGKVVPYVTTTYVWETYGERDDRKFYICASHPRTAS